MSMESEVSNESDELMRSQTFVNNVRAKNAESWQRYILPYVGGGLALLMIVVFGSVLFAGNKILNQVSDHADNKVEVALVASLNADEFDAAKLQGALITYRSIRHHDRASASLLTRELLRFAAFMIGTALTFVGALFVIGKFADISPTTASGSLGNITASLTTASPGIFSIVAGACLVAVAIYAHYDIEVTDSAIKLSDSGITSSGTLTSEQQADLAKLCDVAPENKLCE